MTTDRLDPLTRRQRARDIEELADESAGVYRAETIERYLAESSPTSSAPKSRAF